MTTERRGWFARFVDFCLRQSLWLVSAGLMLASSGLDGEYLTRLMPAHLFWLGYVLNTVADLASEIMMFWFGRLRLLRKDDKRARLAWLILVPEVFLIAYAWFFSWRQLLLVLPAVESVNDVQIVAKITAGFIPLALVAVGYTQALLAGRIETAKVTQAMQGEAQTGTQEQEQAAQDNGHAAHICPWCGASADASGKAFATRNAVSAHLRFCAEYQAQQAPLPVADAGAVREEK